MPGFKEWFQSEEYRQLCKDMTDAYNKTMKELEDNLSQDMVTDIYDWRVGTGPEDINTHSWRGVASLFVEKHPEFSCNHNIHHGNQISGMQLCEAAMKLLNQKPEDGWN